MKEKNWHKKKGAAGERERERGSWREREGDGERNTERE